MSEFHPRFSRFVPAMSLMALVLMAQTVGSEQRYGGAGHGQSSGQGAARGTVQATPTPPPQGKGQTPPGAPSGQRPQPTAEEYLTRFVWWKDDAIKKEVKLTEPQVRRIANIIESRVREITPTYEELMKQAALLDQTAKERTADVASFTLQVGRVEYLRSEVNKTRTVMLYRIMRELDPSQYQKLREILDRPRSGRGGVPPRRTW